MSHTVCDKFLKVGVIHKLFRKTDIDGNDYVTKEEFTERVNNFHPSYKLYTESDIESIFSNGDIDPHDGKIYFGEYTALVRRQTDEVKNMR